MAKATDYARFRGKCRQASEALVEADPTLRLVRGWYTCPIWQSREMHWWTVRQDGTIVDPTKDQFPSKGLGEYEEFEGFFECSECGKRVREADAEFASNYVFCSYACHGRFVGVF